MLHKGSSSLTPAQFALHLPSYYDEYTRADMFPMWAALEARLTAKAVDPGYLDLADLADIAIWGGNQYNRAANKRR